MSLEDDLKQQKIDLEARTTSQNAANDSQKQYNEYLKATETFAINAGKAFVDMNQNLHKIGQTQRDSLILMKRQSDTLGLLATAAMGATKAFDSFGDISGMNNFTGTLDKAVEMAKTLGTGARSALEGIARWVGVNPRSIRSIETLSNTILAAGKRMAQVADSGLKLQTGFLQMSAAGGNLGRVFDQAGPHLENLNNLLYKQAEVLTQTARATNTTVEETTKYYNALGRIPGFLNANIQGIDKAGHSINTLTAAVRIANATGQDENAILKDLATAYVNYGSDVEKAYEFTARISDLSQKYNMRLDDTREYMDHMANSFKFLGENVTSSAAVFEGLIQNLEHTGLSATASKDIIDDFGDSIKNLTIAQKAFLSARTGGPGGLMGAVQIEQEIRQGRMDLVAERMRSALRQQFGHIVTQAEGARSQAGAQEFIRQRMFLQQGPFGQIFGGGAEGEAKATRFLEAMAKPERIRPEEANKLLQRDIQKGTEISNKALTPLTQSVVQLEGIRMLSGVIALNTAQRAFTPETANANLRRELLGTIRDATFRGSQATRSSEELQQRDTSSLQMTRNVKDLSDTTQMFKDAGGSLLDIMKQMTQHSERLGHTVGRAVERREQAHHHATMPAKVSPTASQNITVQVNSVCPNCHKKFVAAPQQHAVTGGAPNMGPGEDFGAGF